MPKELNSISEEVMKKIHEGKLKTRPKIFFIFGSVLAFAGLVSSVLVSVFLFGLLRFLTRAHGPMGEYRLELLLASFPWWAVALAFLGLVSGIWFIRRYDFSYKIDFRIIIVGFILAVMSAALLLDMTGVNDAWARKGPMRGMMQKYLLDENGQSFRGQNVGSGNWR